MQSVSLCKLFFSKLHDDIAKPCHNRMMVLWQDDINLLAKSQWKIPIWGGDKLVYYVNDQSSLLFSFGKIIWLVYAFITHYWAKSHAEVSMACGWLDNKRWNCNTSKHWYKLTARCKRIKWGSKQITETKWCVSLIYGSSNTYYQTLKTKLLNSCLKCIPLLTQYPPEKGDNDQIT